MDKIKVTYKLEDFPKELHGLISGHDLYDSSCHSDAKVYYVTSGFYIKIDKKGSLRREADMIRIFHERGMGVECINYLSLDKDYLVTASAIGDDAIHWLDYPEIICRVMAEALQYLHKQPIEGIPVSLRMEWYQAAGNDIGQIKQDTLIHGDFCLPNIILSDGKFSSLIDFSLSGVGDKHIDLYWAVWSLKYNLGTDKYTDLFLDLYGRENFEEDVLRIIEKFESFC